jgi:hypothetical protein
MPEDKLPYFKAALQGGLIAAVLSILPFIAFANAVCCLWIIGGGLLSARFLSKASPQKIKPADGAVVGALAGIVASIIQSVVLLPQFTNRALLQQSLDLVAKWGLERPTLNIGPMALFFLSTFTLSIIFSIAGALGGIIGVSWFARQAPSAMTGPPPGPPPPPQPPQGPSDAA